LVDAPENLEVRWTCLLWLVFSIHDGEPTFLGIFYDKRNADEAAARIEGARVDVSPSAIRRIG
jgi:hypothetical protein